jgi:uncharacterized repeat protein (TIGR03803 family)
MVAFIARLPVRIKVSCCLAISLLAATVARAASETLVYSFKGGADGAAPRGDLINVGGTLYGTTFSGGVSGFGTVFAVTPAGNEQVVYSFKGGNDGNGPNGGLIDVDGTLYGTTQFGGATNTGTVFKVSTAGAETVLYAFNGGADAANPEAGLINVGGVLYGTTAHGGSINFGTVFKVTTAGSEKVIYAFKGTPDAWDPVAPLVDVGGLLYGTAYSGGTGYNGFYGAVFQVTRQGAEKVVYSFQGGADGTNPAAGMINIGGTLYGTTAYGGIQGYDGFGTVFNLSPSGAETVLYAFRVNNSNDAGEPFAGLTKVGGGLYGATMAGGGSHCEFHVGCGALFAVSPAGAEKVLYQFTQLGKGRYPLGGLTKLGGALYGTTAEGGANRMGSVFKVTP